MEPETCVMCKKLCVGEEGATGPVHYMHGEAGIYCPTCHRRLTFAAPALLAAGSNLYDFLMAAQVRLAAGYAPRLLELLSDLTAAIAEAKPEVVT